MEKSSKKGKLVAGVAAMSLAACCLAAPAFAADNATPTTGTSNTTKVTLTATDMQMKFTVPTVIAFAANAGVTLHIRQLAGENTHHVIEGMFKAVARAMRQACEPDPRMGDALPSTKGML